MKYLSEFPQQIFMNYIVHLCFLLFFSTFRHELSTRHLRQIFQAWKSHAHNQFCLSVRHFSSQLASAQMTSSANSLRHGDTLHSDGPESSLNSSGFHSNRQGNQLDSSSHHEGEFVKRKKGFTILHYIFTNFFSFHNNSHIMSSIFILLSSY